MDPGDNTTSYQNKIGLMAGNNGFLSEGKQVVLDFPYKDCYLEGGQKKEEPDDYKLFHNPACSPAEVERLLAPKAFINFIRYDINGANKVTGISSSDNLFIRGNNLLALHTIRKRYEKKVKLIYIDPPYNTGNDGFSYNDSFDHATWLCFMKNRLEIAKELLREDGFILLQIDNNEGPYLKVLCDEIFGRENYRNSIIVKKGTKSLQKQFDRIQKLNAGFDTIFLYSKNETEKLPNLFKELHEATTSSWNNHWRGTDRPTMRFPLFGIQPQSGQWRWKKQRTEAAVANYKKLLDYINRKEGKTSITDALIDEYYQSYLKEHDITIPSEFELVRLSKHNKPEHYIPPRTKLILSDNWMDLSVAGRLTGFEHEKNEEILQRIIEWLTAEGDIILDFFTGSGSTIAVAHKLQRRYIGIEQLNFADKDATVRLQTVINGDNKGISGAIGWKGGGSFVYMELATSNDGYIEKIKTAGNKELNTIYNSVEQNPYCIYGVNNTATAGFEFSARPEKEKRNILTALLETNPLYISYADIKSGNTSLTTEDIALNNSLQQTAEK